MPLYDEQEYIDILKGYTSEDTRLSRRNLSFISFTIIIISIMDFSLSDIKILGLSFSEQEEWKMILFSAAALVYWWVIYHFHFKHDKMINTELTNIVVSKQNRIVNRDNDNKLEEQREKEEKEKEEKAKALRLSNPNLTGLQRAMEQAQTRISPIALPSTKKYEYGPAAIKIKYQDERTASTNQLKFGLLQTHHIVPQLLATTAFILLYWKLLVYMWFQF